jgi:hypothetical protein
VLHTPEVVEQTAFEVGQTSKHLHASIRLVVRAESPRWILAGDQ